MLPLAGSVAYILIELLPELTRTRTGIQTAKKLKSKINLNRDIKQASANYDMVDTVDNSIRLADELMNKNKFHEALELYCQCLKGIHKTDPHIMSRCAKAQFETGDYKSSKQTLDNLIETNPDFKDTDSHLLFARNLEKLGETKKAVEEYEVLINYASSPESTYHYAMLCCELGQNDKAQELLNGIIQKAKRQGRTYKSFHSEWIKKAKMSLKTI